MPSNPLVRGSLLVAVLLACFLTPSLWADEDDLLLFCFFRDNGQDGVYLAASEDGLHFRPLHSDQPVLRPGDWPEQNLTRDPSIVYHDGWFHAVWTTGWHGSCFGYAESTDLLHWSHKTKVEPFPASLAREDQPRNTWAPEIHWDPIQKNFAILWSTTTERQSRNGDGSSAGGQDGDQDHRIYLSRTSDGRSFTAPQVFFDQGFCVIDAQMVWDNGRWVMVLKDEREIPRGGKNLRLSFAPADLGQPCVPISGPIAGPGSSLRPQEQAEGPALMHWRGLWWLYWDAFANGHYCLATSPDLKSWTDRTAELTMPAHPRHGTVFHVPRAAVAHLLNETPPTRSQ